MTPLFDHPKLLNIEHVLRSHLNPRRRFNSEALAELADNIQRHGVLQPILCRPVLVGEDTRYEIVAGERRWRASKLAAMPEIPAIVREMEDAEALEIAVIENAQREDLHPLEEAEGFEALMRAYGHTDASRDSAEDLAAKIGKSRTYVYNRLKLLALVPDLREAFFSGEFNATVAQQLARLPASLQPKAMAKLRKVTADGEQINVREAGELLRREFHLRLDKATFPIKDVTLLPEAGACTSCPRMSGNEPDLFGDEPDNVCTDPGCFESKLLAHNERQKAKARDAGLTVIEGDSARAMLKFGTTSDELNGDYVYMDRGLANLTGTDKSLKKLLGTLLKPSALFEHPKDQTLREIVMIDKAIKALRTNGLLTNDPDKDKPKARKPAAEDLGTSVATPRDTSQEQPSTPAPKAAWPADDHDGEDDEQDQDDQQAQDEQAHRIERTWRLKAFRNLHRALHDKGYEPPMLAKQLVAIELGMTFLDDADVMAEMCRLWGWEIDHRHPLREQLEAVVLPMNGDELELLLAELIVVPDAFPANDMDLGRSPSSLIGLCEDEEVQIDWQSVRFRAQNPELYPSDEAEDDADEQGQDDHVATCSGPIYPTETPPPAGDDIGAASQGADQSAPEDKSQAPSAQGNEGSQLAHWVGQKVKVKASKRVGTVVDVLEDGTLRVEVESWRTGKTNVNTVLRTDVVVLPGQTHPAAELATQE